MLEIFDYVRVLFYANDMKFLLPVSGFQDRNLLQLNVGKCKTITFARSRHPVEFSYMLGGIVLDRRVSSINDIGVIMDEKMTFSEHVELMVAKAFAMLGSIRGLSLEFYTSLVRPKLKHASYV
jgi:hypothetical protein